MKEQVLVRQLCELSRFKDIPTCACRSFRSTVSRQAHCRSIRSSLCLHTHFLAETTAAVHGRLGLFARLFSTIAAAALTGESTAAVHGRFGLFARRVGARAAAALAGESTAHLRRSNKNNNRVYKMKCKLVETIKASNF